jgi:hypothetical protein
MKRILSMTLAAICLALPLSGAGIESATYNNLVSSITRAREPVPVTTESGRYVIFTATGTSRYTAIAFEHENYTVIHSFKRLNRKDAEGKPEKDEKGAEIGPVLFYIAEVPPEHSELRYRMVVDGLWTTDPLNKSSVYDYQNGMMVSTLPVEYYEVFQTSNVNRGQVRFTYTGTPGSEIRLAGTFNNWDPFMYEMTEIKPGQYELVLPLPRGTWYYAYFEGTNQLPDTTNHQRVYTKDGRVASVVIVE